MFYFGKFKRKQLSFLTLFCDEHRFSFIRESLNCHIISNNNIHVIPSSKNLLFSTSGSKNIHQRLSTSVLQRSSYLKQALRLVVHSTGVQREKLLTSFHAEGKQKNCLSFSATSQFSLGALFTPGLCAGPPEYLTIYLKKALTVSF